MKYTKQTDRICQHNIWVVTAQLHSHMKLVWPHNRWNQPQPHKLLGWLLHHVHHIISIRNILIKFRSTWCAATPPLRYCNFNPMEKLSWQTHIWLYRDQDGMPQGFMWWAKTYQGQSSSLWRKGCETHRVP
jgi:hypothetical protein